MIKNIFRRLHLSTSQANIFLQQGQSELRRCNWATAILICSKAIELEPLLAPAYSCRGQAYANNGFYDARGSVEKTNLLDRAIKDLDKAVELDPINITTYHYRGMVYSVKNNLDKAIRDYSSAIEINENYAIAYCHRGIAYYQKGDFDKAIADLKRAINLNPHYGISSDHPDHTYNAHEYNQAISIGYYSKVIETDPMNIDAYYSRGSLCYHSKFKLRALDDLAMYLQLNPTASNRSQVEQWIRELKGQ